jgi:hypothetical protein
MIAKLLIDNPTILNNTSHDFINESIQKLQKIAYPDNSLEYN